MVVENGVLKNVDNSDLELLKNDKEKFWENVNSIGDNAFRECSNLTQIEIPKKVTSIGNKAFCKCSNLTKIKIPSSVTSLGNYIFSACSNLTEVNIPSSVTSIAEGTFYECKNLTQIDIPSSVTSIGNFAFCGSGLKQISIPSSVTSIGSYAFCGSGLEQISIPNSVTSIGISAFSECESLTQVNIPSSITSIEEATFSECVSLTQVNIPSSVTTIRHKAFGGCKNNMCLNFVKDSSGTIVSIPNMIFTYAMHSDLNEALKISSTKQLRGFNNLCEKFNITDDNARNLAELFKLGKMLGILETDKFITVNGKQVKVSDVAYTLLQNIFVTHKSFPFDKLHAKMSGLEYQEYNEAFLRFFLNKQNCADMLNNPNLIQQTYDWFQMRTNLNFTENPPSSYIPNSEENRFKVRSYAEMEDGHYKYKWNSPTLELIQKELSNQHYVGVTPETQEIADYLSQFPEYKQNKFFQKAVELKREFQELEQQGKVSKSILKKSLKQDLISAVEEYKNSTEKNIKSTEQNLTQTLSNQADSANSIFTYELLPKDSLEVLSMGMLTSCCAMLFGAGSGAQRASMIHPDLQWMVIRDIKGNIVAGALLYVNRKKGYAVVNDVEVNIKYLSKHNELKAIYSKFQKSIENFVDEYNNEYEQPITKVTCGISPNWDGIGEYIKENPKSENILEAIDFSQYGYVGTGHWSGDWQDEQYVIYSAEGKERRL